MRIMTLNVYKLFTILQVPVYTMFTTCLQIKVTCIILKHREILNIRTHKCSHTF